MSERKENPVRRNQPGERLPWVDLPVEGRAGPVPKVPNGSRLQAAGKALWKSIWSTPAATQWGESELPQAVLLCQLHDEWNQKRDKSVLTEARHLRTALGLTAKARNELRWRIVDGDEVVEQNGKTREPRGGKGDGRLRVVDDQAAAASA